MAKRLYRDTDNEIIGGVCSGLAEYLNIDPVIIRIILLALFFVHGFGLLTYIIAWIVIPPKDKHDRQKDEQEIKTEKKETNASSNTKVLIGVVLIIFGSLIALDKRFFYPHFISRLVHLGWEYLIPLALIVAGAIILLQSKKDNNKNDDKEVRDFTK